MSLTHQLLRCHWRCFVIAAFTLGINNFALAQAWEAYLPPAIDGGIIINPPDAPRTPGFTILVQKGQVVSLSAKVLDVDRKLKPGSTTEYDYKNDDGEVDWTKTGAGSLTPARTSSGGVTTYTAPTTVGTYQITATPDDKPTLANDAPGPAVVINVKVIDGCPDSTSIGSSCTAIPDWTYWTSFGDLYTSLCVSGGSPPNPPNNWNGLLVREVVVFKSNTCGAADYTDSYSFCGGSSSWVVGAGPAGTFGDHCTQQCTFGSADNCFLDHHFSTMQSQSYLLPGHGPCTVKCSQTYYCNDKPIGGFTISRTFALQPGGKCLVTVEKN